jgi:flotillin
MNSGGFDFWVLSVSAFIILLFSTFIFVAARYRRCPSDKILVIYGKVSSGQSCRCLHGGGTFVWPLIQDYSYLSLTPITINIPLQNALSLQNIRINVPSTFTVGISTDPTIMKNAAERLLGLKAKEIEDMAKEIIFGQLRLTVASLTIEQINQDRESFLDAIRKNVEPELNKVGLYLINVNITDITDESDYIESIGKKASAEAINRAKVDVAEQVKLGAIGEAIATREQNIKVAENMAEAEKGKKQAEADKRIFLQQKEAEAVTGENTAKAAIFESTAELAIKQSIAQQRSEKGQKEAEADRRVFVQAKEAEAVSGENRARAMIVESNAELAIKQALAEQKAEVARRQAQAEIQRAQYEAELERLNAEEVVQQEVEKRKIEIAAEAEAERMRREAKGQADGTLMRYEAEAKGLRQVLQAKSEGYEALVRACAGDAKAAATLLLIEKMEDLVTLQVEAIKNLKIDRVTVWDSAGGGDKGSTTANFVSSLVKSIPPLHDVAALAGVELPEYLGRTLHQPSQPAEEEVASTEE